MNSLAILETSLSLFVQVTLLIGIAAVIARRQESGQHADSCWAMLHVAILLVTLAAFFLPHLRVTVWADLHPTENYPPGLSTLQIVGSFISWTWGIGALVVVVMGIGGIVKATS